MQIEEKVITPKIHKFVTIMKLYKSQIQYSVYRVPFFQWVLVYFFHFF